VGTLGGAIVLLAGLYFVHGVRGTLALRRLAQGVAPGATPARPGEEP